MTQTVFRENYLLEQYQSGVSDSQFNFFARDYTTKAPLYLKLECKLLRHPGNLDVVAFFYTRDESRFLYGKVCFGKLF